MTDLIIWAQNGENLINAVALIGAVIATLEIVSKLTPTAKDDSAVERIGKIWSKILSILPSNIKKK